MQEEIFKICLKKREVVDSFFTFKFKSKVLIAPWNSLTPLNREAFLNPTHYSQINLHKPKYSYEIFDLICPVRLCRALSLLIALYFILLQINEKKL